MQISYATNAIIFDNEERSGGNSNHNNTNINNNNYGNDVAHKDNNKVNNSDNINNNNNNIIVYNIIIKVTNLSYFFEGLKRSIEQVQDYMDISGLKIHYEELNRIINYNTEIEVNKYFIQKDDVAHSIYQDRNIPIPHFSLGSQLLRK